MLLLLFNTIAEERDTERERKCTIGFVTVREYLFVDCLLDVHRPRTSMIERIFCNIFLLLLLLGASSVLAYKFESCCSNEKNTGNTTTRLLSCPLNFVIKLRSANFYTGKGCAISACQKRFNKHYLPCNHHRTCSISIECILMDASTCPWLTKVNSYSQHLIVEYDCVLNQPNNNRLVDDDSTKKKKEEEEDENIVLFSAKVNIESPMDEMFNETNLLEEEHEWRDYFLKKYFPEKSTIVIEQKRSLFSDILRTVIILIIFASILIIFMVISLLVYKRFRLNQKRKFYDQENKHQPFPADDAYDNFKATAIDTASDSGTTTDV